MLPVANNQQITIEKPKFLKAAEVASIMGISESSAYRIIRSLNEELKCKGFVIVPGKISKRYFEQKVML